VRLVGQQYQGKINHVIASDFDHGFDNYINIITRAAFNNVNKGFQGT
jgi:hypothetical protein